MLLWIYLIQIFAKTLGFSLQPTARGNIISITRARWFTLFPIERLIKGLEIGSVRHWKMCFDFPRYLVNQSFQHCEGKLSCKMPSKIHELLAWQFIVMLHTEMWNMGSQDSFYPPEVKHQKISITGSGSMGTIKNPITCFHSICLQA